MYEYLPHCCASHLDGAQIYHLAKDLAREYASNDASRIVLSAICHRYDVPVVDALRILATAQSSADWRRIPLVDDGRYGTAIRSPWESTRIVSRREMDFLLHGS